MRMILLTATLALLARVAVASYPDGYYNAMDGKQGSTLKNAAKKCVQSHRQLEYYELPNYWQYSDVYPELVNGCKRWWEMYSDATYLIQPWQTGKQSFSANKMQREHAVPKSWWKKAGSVEYTPAYSDMWNLYPSDASANQAKLNYPFGETRSTTFDNGVTKVGSPKAGQGGGAPYVFEPADEYKGDFARTIFYMATVYDDINWVYNYMFVQNSFPTLVPWASATLLQWARQDPVSQKEIDRNDAVEQYQGNRNPFVDFPNLAEYIWGQRSSETFVIADQPNTGATPPITGDPEITAPVSGETLDFGQIATGVITNRVLQIVGSNITEPLSLRVVGADRTLFTPEVTSIPATTINTNGGYLLNIAYAPQSVGKHEAIITLYDGGIDGSIAVSLRGEALEAPAMTSLRALEPSDISETAYTARWEAAPGIADFYTLTRVRYTPEGEETETYETGETFYTVTGRESDVAESYSVTYSRLGLESPASNSVYVAAAGIEMYPGSMPARIFGVEGGVVVLVDGDSSPVITIYSAQGATVEIIENPADGQFVALDGGVYLVAVQGCKPQKIIVR